MDEPVELSSEYLLSALKEILKLIPSVKPDLVIPDQVKQAVGTLKLAAGAHVEVQWADPKDREQFYYALVLSASQLVDAAGIQPLLENGQPMPLPGRLSRLWEVVVRTQRDERERQPPPQAQPPQAPHHLVHFMEQVALVSDTPEPEGRLAFLALQFCLNEYLHRSAQ